MQRQLRVQFSAFCRVSGISFKFHALYQMSDENEMMDINKFYSYEYSQSIISNGVCSRIRAPNKLEKRTVRENLQRFAFRDIASVKSP